MEKNRNTLRALLCAALGNGIFGFSFMFSRIALNYATPFVMLMYRFVITFVLLLIIACCASKREAASENTQIDWLRFKLRGKRIWPLIAMGIIQPVGYFLCESYGISLTNSTFSGVIIALVPIATIVCGMITLKEFPHARQIVMSLVSIAGVILMTVQQRADGQIHFLGVLLLIGAVITGSYFIVISRKISTEFSVLERTVVMMGIAAIAFTLLAFMQTCADFSALTEPVTHAPFLMSILYLALCSSIVAFLAINYANNYLPVVKTAAFSNLTTVVSLFAGVIFLGEPFSAVSLLASVLIVVGIWGIQKS